MELEKYQVRKITYREAIDFILPKHYSGRKPQVKFAYGLFCNNVMISCVTFGIPASHSLCVGVCGEENKNLVIELNRLISIKNDNTYPLSKFVSKSFKLLKKEGEFIIVSYSDMAMNHNGYIYQACNFIYTGCTKGRTDKYTEGNKHSRHYDKNEVQTKRKVRSPKHRYIYFLTKNKKIINSLNYKIQPYPKGENKRYVLGEYLKPDIKEI